MAAHTKQLFEGKLADYFRTRLGACAEALAPPPQHDTLWYITTLLARLGDSSHLFSYEEGRQQLRPLALLYKDAHEAGPGQERCLILRQLGDQALFVGALFPERYARHGLRQTYFIGMGGGAYDYLAEHADSHRSMFAELATRFAEFIDLLAEACARESAHDANDVMALYQRWRRTGCARSAQRLRRIGISLDDADDVH